MSVSAAADTTSSTATGGEFSPAASGISMAPMSSAPFWSRGVPTWSTASKNSVLPASISGLPG
jgi:hypothetical protein